MILCFLPKTFVLQEPGNDYVTGTMTIYNENHIVEVDVRSGLYSSDTIFDYSHGYIATRLFSRSACFILKINKEYIPELEEIGRLAFERQVTLYRNLYCIQERLLDKNWLLYGKRIEQLCSDQNIMLLLQCISTILSFKPKSTWHL
uniref:Gastrokine 2 n=1 Tax=Aquila chrysaetos chrysaetos TaxID=223781 RepID=A0A663E860_AQUCH